MAKKKERTGYKVINVVPKLTDEERKKLEEETVRVFYKMHDNYLRRKQKEEKVVCYVKS